MTQTQSETASPATPAVQPTGPAAIPVDQDCLDRVERMLDLTELAIDVAKEDAAEVPPPSGSAPAGLAVSVVIPVYNERETITEIVRRVRKVGLHREILIIDDYSTDGTREILAELETAPDIRVLLHGYNRGKGAALRTAFARVAGDVVIVQDADLEYDPQDYESLLEPICRGEAEVVYGSRYLQASRQDPSRLHRLGNWLLTSLSNLATGQRLTDMETCYKVFRRQVLQQLELRENRFGIEPEITAKVAQLGYRICEVPVRYDSRSYEEGKKIGLQDGVRAVWCIIRYGLGARLASLGMPVAGFHNRVARARQVWQSSFARGGGWRD